MAPQAWQEDAVHLAGSPWETVTTNRPTPDCANELNVEILYTVDEVRAFQLSR
jgi:hypothetical protein